MLQAWNKDVNQAIEKFTDDLKKELEVQDINFTTFK